MTYTYDQEILYYLYEMHIITMYNFVIYLYKVILSFM